ncbi:MAG: SPOR domain-containing protein [Xanthomonadales bacterium]|jgi:DedD protein|nr:SPOR domain-containing protein [Xanthomonadales bacterium]MDH4000404.1 SPOR domain-containing protein [Xanthomonadales bacterium]
MDTALKQRLVGASVLIALAVVVLPMLLGGRPDGDQSASQKIELPPQPAELDFETRRYPLGDENTPPPPGTDTARKKPLPSPKRAIETSPSPGTASPGASSSSIMEPDESVLEPGDRTAEQAESLPPVVPSSGNGRYVVQVASFGASANARRLSETLDGYGYDVMVDTVKSDVGTLHRVRVGPYASESDAAGVVNKLQVQVEGIKPRVTDLQPERAAQVTKPSDPLVRWVVQVGSFSSATNADNLVARLMLESLTAYKEQVSSSGKIIYRVRVGPFLERQEAVQADTLIGERLAIDGVVMSAD